jgi:hypothetical protein
MTPPRTAIPLGPIDDEESGAILVTDTIRRLGRLEDQNSQILPVLSNVAEAVKNLTETVQDIKVSVKDIGCDFNAFRLETSPYSGRLLSLENFQNRHDTKNLDDIEKARLKAEAILEKDRIEAVAVLETKRRERVEKRNRILTLVGTVFAGVITAYVLGLLGLK